MKQDSSFRDLNIRRAHAESRAALNNQRSNESRCESERAPFLSRAARRLGSLLLTATLLAWAGIQSPNVFLARSFAADSKQAQAEMVKVEPGHFLMGDKDQPDAKPHEVALSGFYMESTS